MNRDVLIGMAWPYGNGSLHFGHMAGLLGADVLARYFRLVDDRVLFVSGTDCHGTPIANKAFQEGKTPAEIAAFYHAEFTDHFKQLGFSYDLYAATMQPHHHTVAQWIFSILYQNGHLVPHRTPQLFCDHCQRFLADRYVEGNCPSCGVAGARGDQCDVCDQTYEATELKQPHCKNCNNPATIRNAEQLFLHLPAFADVLRTWVKQISSQWRANAQQTTLSWLDKPEGLKDRAVTRSIDWGVPIPLPGWDNHRIYVWFEAVIGYLSTSIAAAGGDLTGGPWEAWWRPENKPLHYYIHGKDNIPFHTVIWPAMLMGVGNLALPTHIISSEYLQLPGGQKFSKSGGYGATIPEFLAMTATVPGLAVDSLRHFLTAKNPESKDLPFSWTELAGDHNNVLVNKFGNLVSRAVTMAHRHCQGQIPAATPAEEIMTKCQNAFTEVGTALEQGAFRAATSRWLGLVDTLNSYWNDQRPWDQVKTDPAGAEVTIATALHGVGALSVLIAPSMPEAAARLRAILGTNTLPGKRHWQLELLPAGLALGEPQHLFSRIDRLLLPSDS